MNLITKSSIALGFIAGIAAVSLWWTGGLGNIALVPQSQLAAAVAASLSTANSFAVLAGSGITNTGPTTINGDVGTYATLTETGFGPGADSVTITGTNHVGDATTQGAKTDLVTAYNTTAGEGPTLPIAADLGGQTLTPGVYNSASTIGLTGTVTLDGGGDPNAVFVFQAGSALTTASGSSVALVNGAQSCNVFWQVGSDATLGTGSTFRGTLMALSSITVTTGAIVDGRVLARNGAVTLDTNTIIKPTCSAPALATLHVVKSVINVTGTAVASDFSVNVKTTGGSNVSGSPAPGTVLPGTSYSLSAGSYIVSEATPVGYTQTFGADCPGGSVTLAPGDDKTCTIINTDIPPPPPTVRANGSGGIIPLIGLLKVPAPLALPGGSGSVVYNYTVWNVGGQQALVNVTLADDKCTPITLLSGDTNVNGKLEINETWKYRCTTTLLKTTTNTAVAIGHGNDTGNATAIATAIATVVVGDPKPAPLINIIKVPSRLTPFPFGGGQVTYTYTVTNPGIVPMYGVGVSDDKCAPDSLVSGDTNADGLLNPGESWIYTCTANVTASTINTATAIGKANGFTTLGYAFATVLVARPSLPKSGLAPDGTAPSTSGPIIETPRRIAIPEINVYTRLESVGLTKNGAIGVPSGPINAAWFNLSALPGAVGTAVIDGHFGWKDGVPAVFDDLSKLQKGDQIYVEGENGVVSTFVVRAMQTYSEDADTASLLSTSDGEAHLNLVTCEGVWDPVTKSYPKRLIVFTDKIN